MRERRTFKFFACLAAVALLAGCANTSESHWHLTGIASFIDDDADRNVDDDLAGYQVGVGRSLGEGIKVELNIVGSRFRADGFAADQAQNGFAIDFLQKLGASDYFYPYIVIGAGHFWNNFDIPERADYDGPFAFGGLGVMIPLNNSGLALRTEIRRRVVSGGGNKLGILHDNLLSVGLHVPLGKRPKSRIDSDADGIPDQLDQCQESASGRSVDAYGCARDMDTDNDGVPEALDQCGGTRAGARVDVYGCARSTDAP